MLRFARLLLTVLLELRAGAGRERRPSWDHHAGGGNRLGTLVRRTEDVRISTAHFESSHDGLGDWRMSRLDHLEGIRP